MSKNSDSIDEYRARYRNGPVGMWTTAQGTFDVVSGDVFEFRPDHTGAIRSRSAFSGEVETAFEWREKGERLIEVRYVEEDDDEDWEEVGYDFKTLETDTGSEVVLHEVGQEGFWESAAPLRRVAAQ